MTQRDPEAQTSFFRDHRGGGLRRCRRIPFHSGLRGHLRLLDFRGGLAFSGRLIFDPQAFVVPAADDERAGLEFPIAPCDVQRVLAGAESDRFAQRLDANRSAVDLDDRLRIVDDQLDSTLVRLHVDDHAEQQKAEHGRDDHRPPRPTTFIRPCRVSGWLRGRDGRRQCLLPAGLAERAGTGPLSPYLSVPGRGRPRALPRAARSDRPNARRPPLPGGEKLPGGWMRGPIRSGRLRSSRTSIRGIWVRQSQ